MHGYVRQILISSIRFAMLRSSLIEKLHGESRFAAARPPPQIKMLWPFGIPCPPMVVSTPEIPVGTQSAILSTSKLFYLAIINPLDRKYQLADWQCLSSHIVTFTCHIQYSCGTTHHIQHQVYPNNTTRLGVVLLHPPLLMSHHCTPRCRPRAVVRRLHVAYAPW